MCCSYLKNKTYGQNSYPKRQYWTRIFKFNRYSKYIQANLLAFPGFTSQHFMYYLDSRLKDCNTERVIIHVGVNNIINDNSQSNIEKHISNLEKMIKWCPNYGVREIFISDPVFSMKFFLPMLEGIQKSKLKFLVF